MKEFLKCIGVFIIAYHSLMCLAGFIIAIINKDGYLFTVYSVCLALICVLIYIIIKK